MITISPSSSNTVWTLLYDENCTLCIRFINALKKLNVKNDVKLIALQDYLEKNNNLLLSDLEKDLHLINNHNEILKGDVAVQKLITIIPASKPLKWMLSGKVAGTTATFLYRAAKRLKKRCKSCRK